MSMIDLHSHILAGLDDGASDMEEALTMARCAVADGISAVVSTPHVMPGVYSNSREDILSAVQEFRAQLEKRGITLDIYPGAEYMLDPDLPRWLKEGKVLTINDGGRFLLVEFPSAGIPVFAGQTLFEIAIQGVTPVIAHPERNAELMEDPGKLLTLLERGALCQGTAGSITGRFGNRVRQVASWYLERGCYHFVASDAHDSVHRSPILSKAWDVLEQYVPGLGNLLTLENPGRVLKGLPPVSAPVIKIHMENRGGFWNLLFRSRNKGRK